MGEFVTAPFAMVDDADASGDYDIEVEISCVSGDPVRYSLTLDTASTRWMEPAANGWPVDLLPDNYVSCEGDKFPDFGVLDDEHGYNDVSWGQFYGDMTLVVVSATWCIPCQQFAGLVEDLHEEVEALSDEWGFSVVELLVEDNQRNDARVVHGQIWADAYNLMGPVLTGDNAGLEGYSCLSKPGVDTAIPRWFTVDPLGKVRRIDAGTFLGTGPFVLRIEEDFRVFRQEHPEWVSPRCAGVAGADTLCPCAEPIPGEGDIDDDQVSDSCDLCTNGDDREDWDRDGTPLACDDVPGTPPQ